MHNLTYIINNKPFIFNNSPQKYSLKFKNRLLENQIDIMVYKLYELTYEEVKIVDTEFDKIMSRERYERLKDNL
ncbi:MAG: hypothetical protein H8D22_10055 [Candidatus Cloacimonetes bacterium]|nr:hypothetical protein [Candidatus Cloacimonadota bacterium]